MGTDNTTTIATADVYRQVTKPSDWSGYTWEKFMRKFKNLTIFLMTN